MLQKAAGAGGNGECVASHDAYLLTKRFLMHRLCLRQDRRGRTNTP